jgi:hypothetical protein
MEEKTHEETPVTKSAQKSSTGTVTVVAILIVALAVGGYALNRKNPAVKEQAAMKQTAVEPTVKTSQSFKDGTYSSVGKYVSPAGPEEIAVTVTVKDNVITEATVEPKATAPKSKFMQGVFKDNFKEMVVGKNISEVKLTKVSGSSLTPKGFNDALDQIKKQASA